MSYSNGMFTWGSTSLTILVAILAGVVGIGIVLGEWPETLVQWWRLVTMGIGGALAGLSFFIAIKYAPIVRIRNAGILAWHVFFLGIGTTGLILLTGYETLDRWELDGFTFRLPTVCACYLFLTAGLVCAYLRVHSENARLLSRSEKVFQ